MRPAGPHKTALAFVSYRLTLGAQNLQAWPEDKALSLLKQLRVYVTSDLSSLKRLLEFGSPHQMSITGPLPTAGLLLATDFQVSAKDVWAG